MKKRIVITGIGALSALGHTIDSICANSPEQNGMRQYDPSTFLRVTDFDGTEVVKGRLKRKLDNFTFYGLCAADMALKNSGVLDSDIDLSRVGIFVGNCLGGWGFAESKIKALHTENVEAMGPYVATAWFPAALQGQISLQYGLKGYSKTFSASNVAGLQAIGYGVEAIQRGRADVVLCGASEDLSSSYIRAMLDRSTKPGGVKTSVFGDETPAAFSEGAAFLVLEEYENARKRGATTYCEISGFADHFCSDAKDVNFVLRNNALNALSHPDAPYLFLTDAAFEAEASSTKCLHNDIRAPLYIASGREHFGNMFAVSGVMETVCAARNLCHGTTHPQHFDASGDPSLSFNKVMIRRLSKQGSVSTLSLASL
ncbi:beta-ketoacyl synthase N-terminal-like domain-containing protein [Erwinia sp. P7711]|uniref:beta-ketoacyl synthase N-terminal-like domain-containing protein n=1 Tax=Erwinia sp. P7711 TaxID=3141451 RepID=UPI00318B51B8